MLASLQVIYHGDKFLDCRTILERQYTMSQITLFVVHLRVLSMLILIVVCVL